MADGFEVGMIFRHRVSGLRLKLEKIEENTLWCSYPDYPPVRSDMPRLRKYEKHPSDGRPFGVLHKIESLPEDSAPAISPSECDGTRYCVAETHIHGCFAERAPANSPHEHTWSLPGNSGVYRCMTCGVETTDLGAPLPASVQGAPSPVNGDAETSGTSGRPAPDPASEPKS